MKSKERKMENNEVMKRERGLSNKREKKCIRKSEEGS